MAESSQYSYHVIDHKLKKLNEQITLIKESEIINPQESLKDLHIITLLLQYISDSISIIIFN
jgi:hypothetical protein